MREERRAGRGAAFRCAPSCPMRSPRSRSVLGPHRRPLRHRRRMGQGASPAIVHRRRARRHGRPHRPAAARPDPVRRRARFAVRRDRLRRLAGDHPPSLGRCSTGRASAGCSLSPIAVCMALRLARFNARIDVEDQPHKSAGFLTGVPAPAGAGLLLLPISAVAGQRPAMGLAARLSAGRALGGLRRLPGDFERRHLLLGLAAAAAQRPAGGDRRHRPDRRRAVLGALGDAERRSRSSISR